MPADDLKQLDQRIYNEAWNAGKLDVLSELIASGAAIHDPGTPGIGSGPEGMKQLISMYRDAFPDTHFTIESQVTEGDFVLTRWRAHGTHRGTLMGVPPTNRVVDVAGMSLSRYANGKSVESWTNWDTLGLMQQIGVIPAMAPAAVGTETRAPQQ